MSEDPMNDLWAAFAEARPFDRVTLGLVFVVTTGIAWLNGLGLLSPLYGLLLVVLAAANFYVLVLLGKAKRK